VESCAGGVADQARRALPGLGAAADLPEKNLSAPDLRDTFAYRFGNSLT
jgi:hypothetical protein